MARGDITMMSWERLSTIREAAAHDVLDYRVCRFAVDLVSYKMTQRLFTGSDLSCGFVL